MQILERIRNGAPLTDVEDKIISALKDMLRAYPASKETQALEILGIIDLIYEANDELLRRNPDYGQHRTDDNNG